MSAGDEVDGGLMAAARRYLGGTASRRLLSLVFLIDAVGTGLFMTGSTLFYTRYLGFTPGEAAAGLALGGLAGLVSGFTIGHLADRKGPRGIYAASLAAQALAMAAFVAAQNFVLFVVANCLAAMTMNASVASRAPLIRGYGGDRPTQFRAFLRTCSNLGIAVGSLLAGVLIAVGTPGAYLSVVLINAVSFAICAVIVLFMERLAPIRVPEPSVAWAAFKDFPFMATAVLSTLVGTQLLMLPFVIPLWIADHTGAPNWVISMLFLASTAGGVLFQVRASRGVNSVHRALRTLRWAGISLALAYVTFGLAQGRSGVWAVMILLAATIALTVGDLWETTASTELSFRLAPEHAQGSYQGAFQVIRGVMLAFTPAVLTWLILGHGIVGWVVLACVVMGAAVALRPLVVRMGAGNATDL